LPNGSTKFETISNDKNPNDQNAMMAKIIPDDKLLGMFEGFEH
jgi:hypothetical protein